MIFVVFSIVFAAPQTTSADAPIFLASNPPLAAIVSEIAAGRGQAVSLLPAGASPHTFEARPSDMARAENARLLFYTSGAFDGWSTKLPVKTKVPVFEMVPQELRCRIIGEHQHNHAGESGHHHAEESGYDAHFWPDPLTVKAILPAIAGKMCDADSAGCETYKRNAAAFAARLDALHAEINSALGPYKERQVLFTYPFFTYFLKRYGFQNIALLVEVEGREPSPRHVKETLQSIAASKKKIKAVFTGEQLSSRPAELLAESAGLEIITLDPLGGVPGRMSYEEIMRHNLKLILKGLQ